MDSCQLFGTMYCVANMANTKTPSPYIICRQALVWLPISENRLPTSQGVDGTKSYMIELAC